MGGSSSKPAYNPNLLYRPEEKACIFKDSGEFKWRVRQLEMMNYIIRKMGKVLCMPTAAIDFNRLLEDIMKYHDVHGNEDKTGLYDYRILANDVTFKAPWEDLNQFAKLKMYFQTKGGRSKEEMKSDFEEYMEIFIRLRDTLVEKLVERCSSKTA